MTQPDRGLAGRAAAIDFVWRKARRYLITRHQFDASVTEAVAHGFLYSRAISRIEHRTIELALTVGPTWTRPAAPLPDPGTFDPWLQEDQVLRRETACVATCPECRGAERSLAPRDEPRGCPLCHGYRTVHAHLWIRSTQRETVSAHPPEAASVHRRLLDPGDFMAGTYPYEVLDEHSGADVVARLPSELAPLFDSASERVTWAHIQVFDARFTEVRCRTRFGESRLFVGSPRMRFVAVPVFFALARRATFLLGLGGTLFLAPLIAYLSFVGRGPFFARYGHPEVVVVASSFAAVAGLALATQLTLVRQARSRQWLIGAASALAAGFCLAALLFLAERPSIETLRTATEGGDVTRADIEGDELDKVAAKSAELEAALDEWKLRRIRRSMDVAERVRWFSRRWYSQDRASAARTELATSLREEVRKAYEKDDRPSRLRIRQAGGGFDPALDVVLDALDALYRLRDCMASDDVSCALRAVAEAERTRDLETEIRNANASLIAFLRGQLAKKMAIASAATNSVGTRQAFVIDAITIAEELTRRTGSSSPSLHDLGALEAGLRKTADRRWHEEMQSESVRLAAAARSAAQDDDGDDVPLLPATGTYRPLVCCDGTVSTRCMCGDSKIACCMLHGGRCGCQ